MLSADSEDMLEYSPILQSSNIFTRFTISLAKDKKLKKTKKNVEKVCNVEKGLACCMFLPSQKKIILLFFDLKIPDPKPGDPLIKFSGLNNLFSEVINSIVSFSSQI